MTIAVLQLYVAIQTYSVQASQPDVLANARSTATVAGWITVSLVIWQADLLVVRDSLPSCSSITHSTYWMS